MLELMIALFLVSIYVLPLAQLPMKALREEINTSYRMQLHRYADLAFAEFKEQLYRQKIPWEKLCNTSSENMSVENVEISFAALGKRTLIRTVTLRSVGKKGKNTEEWRLVTFKVTFKSQEKKLWLTRTKKGNPKPACTFEYRLLVGKAGLAAPPPPAPELDPPKPVKEIALPQTQPLNNK